MDFKNHRLPLLALLIVVVAAVLPFVLGSVGDTEEFYGTAIPMTLAFRALGEGASPFWTPLLGLGMPQPFRISYLMHPLGFTFAFGAEFGMNVLTAVHLAIGAAATYCLALALGISRPIAVLCAASIVFSTTVTQVLYYDNWFTHIVSWSLLPLAALMLLRLLDAGDRASAAFYALALGLTVGFQISTGLIIRPIIYVLLLAPLALARPIASLQRLGWIAAAALVALACGATNILPLFDEFHRAAATAVRAQHHDFTLSDHLWGAFGRPLAVLTLAAEKDASTTLRVVGFGPVFAALAVIQLLRTPANPNIRAVAVALLGAVAYLVLPASVYLDIIPFTWPFRDGVNLYGVLLGGVLLTSMRPRYQLALGALQGLLVLAAAAPLWMQNLSRAWAPEAASGATARDLERGGDIIRALQASGAGQGRTLFAPRFREGRFARDGISTNTLAYHGLPVVDAFARGIATGALHPDFALLEGDIRAGPATLFDVNLMKVLGITHVLALADDRYAAGLALERTVRSRSGEAVRILRNRAAWPRAVFLDEAAIGLRLARLPDCGHDRLLCADFAPVVAHRRPGPAVAVEERYGTIRINLPPADTPRLLMLSTWFRPGWRVAPANVSVFPIFEELTAIRVPAGVTDIRMSYLPAVRLWPHIVAAIVLLAGVVMMLALRGRGAGAAAPAGLRA
jgi:hypothetical protein